MEPPARPKPQREPHRASDGYIVDPLDDWFLKFEQWGMRVRDDILRLEDVVIDLTKGNAQFDGAVRTFERPEPGEAPDVENVVGRYQQRHPKRGDPGDPPRGPW